MRPFIQNFIVSIDTLLKSLKVIFRIYSYFNLIKFTSKLKEIKFFQKLNLYILIILQENLTTSNFDALVSLLASELTSHFERAVMSCQFNRVSIIQICWNFSTF